MATYRKPLKDIDGNFIIPAMTGDQTEWVQTGDIADGAITPAKLGSGISGGFSRYVSSTSVTNGVTNTVIAVPNTVYADDGVSYDSSTGKLTIQKAGWWSFEAQIGGAVSAASTVSCIIAITKGTSDYMFTSRTYHTDTSWGVYANSSGIMKLDVGDTVCLIGESQGANLTNIDRFSRGHISGTLVCPS